MTFKALRSITRKHGTHHSLTTVTFYKISGDASNQTIKSNYAIKELRQDASSTFPSWALGSFMLGFTPIFILLKFIFPNLPIFVGGYLAVSFSYFLYEGLHYFHHKDDGWWRKKIKQKISGKAWLEVYIFHKTHHANTECNLNVGGFLGIPVADLIFQTYKRILQIAFDEKLSEKDIQELTLDSSTKIIEYFDRKARLRERRILTEDKKPL